jgi:coenzyme F420-reducing hydrogenase delta subunit
LAEYNEWNQKGATLSDVTAKAEYGIDHEFIIKGIKTGILEYREGTVWGNPFLRILRSQLEKYIVKELGEEYLTKANSESEMRKIRKEITEIKKRMNALQLRKTSLEKALNK